MNQLRLLAILERLKKDIYDLECELKSDPESYLPPMEVDYKEICTYFNYGNDDDQEGL